MPTIEIASSDLRHRGACARQVLRHLVGRRGGPASDGKSRAGAYIIGMHDGAPPSSNVGDWRFATTVHQFRANYSEVWEEVNEGAWCLRSAYLNIYRTDPATHHESAFLSLHCDPNEADDAPHARYKRGPHLHIEAAVAPLPHAHLALCLGNLDVALSSVDSLTQAMEQAIMMLKEEVFDSVG